jgi:hypothetical protein
VSPSFVISHASSLARRSLEPVLDAGVVFLSHQHCPGDPNRLIRHRHDPLVEASSIDHCLEPERPWIALRLQTERDGASAMDKLATQLVIGAPPNPGKTGFAAVGILAGDETDPGCHLPPRSELPWVADAGRQRRRDDRADAGQSHQAPACLVVRRRSSSRSMRDYTPSGGFGRADPNTPAARARTSSSSRRCRRG